MSWPTQVTSLPTRISPVLSVKAIILLIIDTFSDALAGLVAVQWESSHLVLPATAFSTFIQSKNTEQMFRNHADRILFLM